MMFFVLRDACCGSTTSRSRYGTVVVSGIDFCYDALLRSVGEVIALGFVRSVVIDQWWADGGVRSCRSLSLRLLSGLAEATVTP